MGDIELCRSDFPILSESIRSQPLIYLDNAATTQMPSPVLNCLMEHYQKEHANVHRGSHYLSSRSTDAMERARAHICSFLSPGRTADTEVVFTSGTTDSLNIVAMGLRDHIKAGDEIIVSALEHHSNYVPWQQLCLEKGAVFKVVPIKAGVSGFDMEAYEQLLSARTKIVAVTQTSNLTGERLPLMEIARRCKVFGAFMVVDGAQGIRLFDFQEINSCCDFYCFSAHKLFGPAGVGVLYGKKEFLAQLKPVRYGGGMIQDVTKESTTFADVPYRLEAGTPNFPGIIAFDRALSYLEELGLERIRSREAMLGSRLYNGLRTMTDARILGYHSAPQGGHSPEASHIVSVHFPDVDDYDLACFLDRMGIAVRQGKHCAYPAMRAFGMESAVRISPAFYNTPHEIDTLIDTIGQARSFFGRCRM